MSWQLSERATAPTPSSRPCPAASCEEALDRVDERVLRFDHRQVAGVRDGRGAGAVDRLGLGVQVRRWEEPVGGAAHDERRRGHVLQAPLQAAIGDRPEEFPRRGEVLGAKGGDGLAFDRLERRRLAAGLLGLRSRDQSAAADASEGAGVLGCSCRKPGARMTSPRCSLSMSRKFGSALAVFGS